VIISFQLLALALKTLPIGTAYAIWTGSGTVVLGMVLFGESRDAIEFLLIITGIAGLKIASPH